MLGRRNGDACQKLRSMDGGLWRNACKTNVKVREKRKLNWQYMEPKARDVGGAANGSVPRARALRVDGQKFGAPERRGVPKVENSGRRSLVQCVQNWRGCARQTRTEIVLKARVLRAAQSAAACRMHVHCSAKAET